MAVEGHVQALVDVDVTLGFPSFADGHPTIERLLVKDLALYGTCGREQVGAGREGRDGRPSRRANR